MFFSIPVKEPKGIPGCLLYTSTNTSALSVTEIAVASQRPSQVVGMHFFNPVPVMKLVEIIPGVETADETVAVVTDLSKKIGKEPVLSLIHI